MDFCEEKESCHELSAELAGDGGVSTCSDGGQDVLGENESCGLGGLWPKAEMRGLKGPRGKGSARGRGGSLRSSASSEIPEPSELKELRMLFQAQLVVGY